jgi:hypothetical protein
LSEWLLKLSCVIFDDIKIGCVINYALQNFIAVKGNLLKIIFELKRIYMISMEHYRTLIELLRGDRGMSLPEYILRLLMLIPFEDLCFILDRQGLNTVVMRLRKARNVCIYQRHKKENLIL